MAKLATRINGWQNYPVPEGDRRLYQMTTKDNGSWQGGRAGSYIAADNFHGTAEAITTLAGCDTTGDPKVYEGSGHDNTHGDYPYKFMLHPSGELECAFVDTHTTHSARLFFARGGGGGAVRTQPGVLSDERVWGVHAQAYMSLREFVPMNDRLTAPRGRPANPREENNVFGDISILQGGQGCGCERTVSRVYHQGAARRFK